MSNILILNPVLDSDGVMRSIGRLTASESLFYHFHHILSAFHSILSELLFTFTDRIFIHEGNQLIVRLIRTRYWIPKLRPGGGESSIRNESDDELRLK